MGFTAVIYFAIACIIPAMVTSALATAVMRRMAPKWDLVDQPGKRKVHVTPTPLGGGVGIWLGVVLPIAAVNLTVWILTRGESVPDWIPREFSVHFNGVLYRSGQMWAILAAGTILASMGLLDDLKNLPWQPRLLIQCLVAAALVAGGVRATIFAPQPWIGFVFSFFWILVLVNAFNFLDNMDGLSSGIALIAAALFAIVMLTSTNEPHWLVGGALLVLTGAIAGFLFFHNWPPARIFMGDSGSYFIGLLLACLTMLGTFYEETGSQSRHVILAPLCILAVPLYDFVSVLLIRLSQKRSPFHPDKSHFSHRLVDIGMQSRYAVLTIYLATLTTGLGALLLYQIPGWNGALLVVALIVCVLAIIAILETVGRKNNQS